MLANKIIGSFFLFIIYAYYSPFINPEGLIADKASGMLIVYFCYFFIGLSLPYTRINTMSIIRFKQKKVCYIWYLKKSFIYSFLYVTCVLVTYFILIRIFKYEIRYTGIEIIRYFLFSIINLIILNFIVFLIRIQKNVILGMTFNALIITASYIMSGPMMQPYNFNFIASAYSDFGQIFTIYQGLLIFVGYLFIIGVMLLLISKGEKIDLRT